MENLNKLLDGVYRQGLGVSRQHVRARIAYIDAKVPDTSSGPEVLSIIQERTLSRYEAEFEYLGGRLADRAFQNMPHTLRQLAYNWSEMDAEDQEKALQQLQTELASDRWVAQRNIEDTRHRERLIADPYGAFPEQTKSWQRGPHMPNCLGMAQMLVGFARAAGAQHKLLTPLIPSWYSALTTQRRQIAYITRQLETFPDAPYVRKWKRLAMRLDKTILKYMAIAKDELAHHALAIELADGSVRMVDPYMGGYATLHIDGLPEDKVTVWRRTFYSHGIVPFTYDAVVRAASQKGRRSRSLLQRLVRIVGEEPPRTKRAQARVYNEVIDLIVCYGEVVVKERTSDAPVLFELSDPALSIAAYTLNHYSVVCGVPGDAIVKVLALQYVIRDQFEILKKDPRFPEWFSGNFIVNETLPELRSHLVSMKKGNPHDKTSNAESGTGGCGSESDERRREEDDVDQKASPGAG